MRDLLIISPTRGRPDSARRLIGAVAATATARTDLILAVDDDDPSYDEMADTAWSRGSGPVLSGRHRFTRGPRMTCPAWTNKVAMESLGLYRAFASLGDDHVPETPGWDALLLAALEDLGGTGIAYGDDCVQHEALATAPVVSADIVATLGWFMYPLVRHVFADNVWMDLGREAGCLRYVPDAVIRHLHWSVGTAPRDLTYMERDSLWPQDEQAWLAWQREDMAIDAAKVRALCQRA